MRADRLVLGAFLALLLLVPAILSPYYVTLLNYIGLYAMVALGLVLLTGVGGLTSFGQAAFVGLGAYTTAALTTATDLPAWLAWAGGSPWLTLVVGPAADRVGGGADRLADAEAFGPLPAPGHDRVGHQPVLPLRHDGEPGRAHRHQRHPGDRALGLDAGRGRRDLLPDLGLPARGHAHHPQPARLARGPRHPRAQGRAGDGRGDGRGHLARAHGDLRDRGPAGLRLGLAVCAHAALRRTRPRSACTSASSTSSWRWSAAPATCGGRSSARRHHRAQAVAAGLAAQPARRHAATSRSSCSAC